MCVLGLSFAHCLHLVPNAAAYDATYVSSTDTLPNLPHPSSVSAVTYACGPSNASGEEEAPAPQLSQFTLDNPDSACSGASEVHSSSAQLNRTFVTGAAIGLPNELYPETTVLDPSNFDRLFSGTNFISALSPHEQQAILDQNVVQVIKTKDGQRVKQTLSSPAQVIKLASKLGSFDLTVEYGVPAHVVDTLDSSYQLAIAAGLEALANAGIDVYSADEHIAGAAPAKRHIKGLPEHMQAETGPVALVHHS